MVQLRIWGKSMETKKDIRKRILSQRKKITPEEWQEKSRQIYQRVTAHPLFLAADEVYCYVNYNQEADTARLIQKCWKLGKKTAVPKVLGDQMEFFYITSFDELEEGYYHIMEPVTKETACAAEALVIMPGAAFDEECHRIGYGGGFYDKYLEKHPEYHRLAIAFEMQITGHVPADTYDIKPEVIITEDRSIEEELFTDRWL